METGSSSGVNSASIAMTSRDTLAYFSMSTGHEDAVGAEPRRAADGHGRVDAEPARLVRGGGHHPAPATDRAHDHRPAAQLGPVALLHGRVERVHVDVEHSPARDEITTRETSRSVRQLGECGGHFWAPALKRA